MKKDINFYLGSFFCQSFLEFKLLIIIWKKKMQEIAAVKNLHGILYYHFHNTDHTKMMHYNVMLSEYYHTL